MIYFIQDTAGNIKIGHANDVQKRIRSLQTAHAGRLRLLATIPGNPFDERRLHERFAAYRLGGEWFSPVPELLAFIGAPVEAPPTRKRGPLFPIQPGSKIESLLPPEAPRSPFAGLVTVLWIAAAAAALVLIVGVL